MKPYRSLRSQIELGQLGLLAVVVLVLLVGFYIYERRVRLENIDLTLSVPESRLLAAHIILPRADARSLRVQAVRPRERGSAVERLSRGSSDGAAGVAEAASLPWSRGSDTPRLRALETVELLEAGQLYALVWRGREGLVFSYGVDDAESFEKPAVSDHGEGRTYRWRGSDRELIYIGRRGETIVVGKAGVSIDAELATFGWGLAGVGVVVLLLGALRGRVTSGRVLRPVERISRTARRIAEGDLSERIDESDTEDELNELAKVLNTTFARLADALERQIKFSADASHELLTPASIILTECQWALDRARELEDCHSSFATCEKAARHMRDLIEALLELSRMDAEETPLTVAPVRLRDLMEEAQELLTGLAERRGVRLDFQVHDVSFTADGGKIRQVVINLVNNAIHHSPAEGVVRVTGRVDGPDVIIEVADEGPGIAEAEHAKIFDRFYRTDKARSRERGGSGLGLAISLVIARAHGGDLTVRSAPDEGSCFILSVPVVSKTPVTT